MAANSSQQSGTSTGSMPSLFISYSRKDIIIAQKLSKALEDQGLDCWIDWEGIPPTVDWWNEIKKGIEAADAFLFLLSPDSSRSKVCEQEIEHAVLNGKRLIPIVVRDTEGRESPAKIAQLNWIFLRESDNFQASFDALITAIKTDYQWVQEHRQLQLKSLEWEKNNHESSLLLRGKELQDAEYELARNSSKDPRPTDLQHEYVFASRRESDRQRRTATATAIGVIIALIALTIFGFTQADHAKKAQATAEANAQEAQRRARIARSQTLAAYSQLNNEKDSLGVLLALEAFSLVSDQPHEDRILPEQALRDSLSSAGPMTISDYSSPVRTLAFSPNGQWLAVGRGDSTLGLWNMQDPDHEPLILRSQGDDVAALVFSLDSRWLVTQSSDGITILWNMQNPTDEPIILSSLGPDEFFATLAFSPDGEWLAAGRGDAIGLWNMQNVSAEPILLRGHGDVIYSLGFSPDSRWLASGSEDASARVWDIKNLSADPIVLHGHGGIVGTVMFTPDGRWLITSGEDATARLWDVKRRFANPTILRGFGGAMYAIAVSPDSQWLAGGSDDGTIRLWNLQNPTASPLILRGHEGYITSLNFSPDGQWLAAGSSDATTRIWEMQNTAADPVVLRGQEDLISVLAFSPDSQSLVAGSQDMTVDLWPMDAAELAEIACQVAGRNLMYTEWTQFILNEEYRKTCNEYPRHESYYKQSAENILSNTEKPQRLQEAFDTVKEEMKTDTSIKDPLPESYRIVAEMVSAEISNEELLGNWLGVLDLLAQAEAQKMPVFDELMKNQTFLNSLCWNGSLNGHAAQVLEYCDKAVALAPDDPGIRDSRGLSLALVGDYSRAIMDFQFYVENAERNAREIEKRQQWISHLRAGNDPFTPEVLEQLQDVQDQF